MNEAQWHEFEKRYTYESLHMEGNDLSEAEVSWVLDHMEQVEEWLQTDRENVYIRIKEAMK